MKDPRLMAGDFFFKSGCAVRAGHGEALVSIGLDEVQGRADYAGRGCELL